MGADADADAGADQLEQPLGTGGDGLGRDRRPSSRKARSAASQNGQPSPQTSGMLGQHAPTARAPGAASRVRLRQDREQPVLAHRVVVQFVQVVSPLRQDHQLEIAAAQGLAQLARAIVVQRDLGVGIAVTKCRSVSSSAANGTPRATPSFSRALRRAKKLEARARAARPDRAPRADAAPSAGRARSSGSGCARD